MAENTLENLVQAVDEERNHAAAGKISQHGKYSKAFFQAQVQERILAAVSC